MHAYPGSVGRPFPPQGTGGWAVVGYGDALARQRAEELSQYMADGRFPCWHYHDELLSSGLCRFFAFEGPDGRRGMGAMRFVGGDAPTLGLAAGGDPGTDPGAGADPGTGDTGQGGQGKQQGGGGGGLPSGDGIQCDAPAVPNAAGTACITPGGGQQQLPNPPKPAPAPASGGSSSSGSSGLVIGIVAALAVAGTIVAASAAKHPVRSGHR